MQKKDINIIYLLLDTTPVDVLFCRKLLINTEKIILNFKSILCCKPEYRLYYEQQLIRELNSQYNVFTNVSDSPLRQFTFTEQSKLKMSIAHKGKKLSEQHKHNISLANKGRVFSKESKDKIRKAKQNTTLSQETIKKMSEAKKGKPWSEKRRAAYLKKTYNEQIS